MLAMCHLSPGLGIETENLVAGGNGPDGWTQAGGNGTELVEAGNSAMLLTPPRRRR